MMTRRFGETSPAALSALKFERGAGSTADSASISSAGDPTGKAPVSQAVGGSFMAIADRLMRARNELEAHLDSMFGPVPAEGIDGCPPSSNQPTLHDAHEQLLHRLTALEQQIARLR